MAKLVDRLRATAFRKGVVGSSRTWFALWTGVSVARFARKRLGKQQVVVERYVLRPGETIEIRDTSVSWGELKKIEKAAKRR